MNLVDAIKSGFVRCFDFSGRSIRSEFWYWTLFITVASIILSIIDAYIAGVSWADHGTGVFEGIFGLLTVIPGLSITIRRLHDVNRTGWWVFLFFTIIGIILLIYWACIKGTDGKNRFGEDPLE